MLQYVLQILVLSFLFIKSACQSNCLLFDLTKTTQCLQCQIGFYNNQLTSFQQSFSPSNCVQATGSSLIINYYVTSLSTCNTNCDGTQQNPFSNLLQALGSIPYPIMPQIPNVTIFIQDQNSYILYSHITTQSVTYYNRRIPINLFILPDPAKQLIKPIIYIKTEIFSIFVAVSLKISGFIISGLGLNELPTSFTYQPQIFCSQSLQMKNSSSVNGVVNCGINGSQLKSLTNEQESYGLFTLEPMFDMIPVIYPTILIQGCTFQDFYPIEAQRFSALVKIGLQLPGYIIIQDSQFNNIFFEQGMVSSIYWKNWLWNQLQLSSNSQLLKAYGLFQIYQSVSVQFQNVIITGYNNLRINHIPGFDVLTGAIVSIADQPLNLYFTSTIFNASNITIPSTNPDTNTETGLYVIEQDGIDFGHYSTILYTSRVVIFDKYNIPLMSNLIINQLTYDQVGYNAAIIFHAIIDQTYFLNPLNKLHNQMTLNALTCTNSFLRYVLIHSNADFFVSNNYINNITVNMIYLATVFSTYNYQQNYNLTSSIIQNLQGFYVGDDEINELNCILYNDNSTTTTPKYPIYITIKDCTFQNMSDMVIFEGRGQQPITTLISNIIIHNHVYINLIWGLFGSFFQQLLVLENITISNSYIWEVATVKQVPPYAYFKNFQISTSLIQTIITFRGSVRTQYNWTLVINNLTQLNTFQQCESKQFWSGTIIKDNARREDLTKLTSLGTFYINNSNIQLCAFRAQEITSIYSLQSPWNKVISDTNISSYGPIVVVFLGTTYVSPFNQSLSWFNSRVYRYGQITDPPQQLWSSKQQANADATTYFIDFSSHYINITNCSFYDTGYNFAKIRIINSLGGIVQNVAFYNFGFYLVSPLSQLNFQSLTMNSSNRNQTSFFILVQKSLVPTWINNKQIGTGVIYSDLIVRNCSFYGNLTNGIFQLTNSKVYVENSIIATKDIYLDYLQLNNTPIPTNLTIVSSPITLKTYGWIYLNNSQMFNCSSSTNNKLSCIDAFRTAVVEAYNTSFKNSNSSFGSFIYGFRVSIYIQNCVFMNGLANKGGSIYLISSTLNILGGVFDKSTSIYTGGHIYADNSTITIDSTIFKNGYSQDSGSSIYGTNMLQLTIIRAQFINMSATVQAVLFLSSQNFVTLVSIYNVVFQNCSSQNKAVTLYLYQATLDMQNVQFNNQILQSSKNIILSDQNSLITLIQVTLNINSVIFYGCQTYVVMDIQQSQGNLVNVTLSQTYFDKYVFYTDNSNLQFNQFSLTLLDDTDFIHQLQIRKQYVSQSIYRKTIFYLQDGSNIQINNSILTQQIIVIMLVGYESSSLLQEIISGIQSVNSNLQIMNTVFQDQYLISNIQFTSQTPYQQRILQGLQDSLNQTQASSLDFQGGSVQMINLTFPNFAIGCPIMLIQNSEFNISHIINQELSLLTKSIIDSYCQGPYKSLCQFIDYKFIFTSTFNPQGIYSIQNSSCKSYGTSLNFTSIFQSTPIIIIMNLQLQSRSGESDTTPIFISNSNIQLKNLTVNSYSQPLTISSESTVQITNGQITNGQNGGILIYGGIIKLINMTFDSNTAISGGALYSQCQQGQQNQITMNNCSFTNNIASASGGAIRNVNCPLQINNSTFNNNQANYGQDFLGFPATIILHQIVLLTDQTIPNLAALSLNISIQALKNSLIQNQTLYVVGGQIATFVMNVVDNFGQIYPLGSYFNSKQIQQIISSKETQVKVELIAIDQNIKVTLVSYSFELLSNAIVITEFYVFVSENYVGALGYNLIGVFIDGNSLGTFELVILPCPQGSISSSDRCFLCPNSTFSLNSSDEKCINCEKYQDCNGKNYLFADEGYYISANTSQPQTCSIMHACSQTIISNDKLDIIYWINHYQTMVPNQTFQQMVPFLSTSDIQLFNTTKQNYCAPGYQGPFCSTCLLGYGQTSDGFCYECSTSQTIYIKFFISFMIVLAINYKDSVEPLQMEDPDRPLLSQVILKQITDFTQFVNIVIGMISNVSPTILPVLSVMTNQVSLFPTDFRSGFDCFFLQNVSDPIQKFKYQLVVSSLIPWGFLITLIFMILIIDKIKKFLKSESIPSHVTLIDIFIVTMVANLYNFYFFLAQICLNLFSCVQFNDATAESGYVTVLSVMTDIQCFQEVHLSIILTYALPTFLIYVIGIPCMFAFFISKYYKETPMRSLLDYQLKSDTHRQSSIIQDDVQQNRLDYIVEKIEQSPKHHYIHDKQSYTPKDDDNDENRSIIKKDSSIENKEIIESSQLNKGFQDGSENNKEISNSKNEEKIIVRYSGFLTDNLKQEYKYWGIYIQFKKLLIITIMILTQSLNVATASIIVLIVFITFMLISYKHQPYQYTELNINESANDLLLTLIIHLSLLIVQSKTQGIQVIAVIAIIILKFVFYYYGFKIIVKEYLQYFRKMAEQITEKKQKNENGV